MVAVVRLVSTGVLILALVLAMVGFATNNWISKSLYMNDIMKIINASGMDFGGGSAGQGSVAEVHMGLWKVCATLMGMSNCFTMPAHDKPGFLTAVVALGIFSMIAAAGALLLMIYSLLGKAQGDRARLQPYYITALSFAAGLILLVAVAIYLGEFRNWIDSEFAGFSGLTPVLSRVAEIFKDMSLSWSFALVVAAGILMIVSAALVVFLLIRGFDDNVQLGSLNLAV